MKKQKLFIRILSALLCILILFGLFAPSVMAVPLTGVDASDWKVSLGGKPPDKVWEEIKSNCDKLYIELDKQLGSNEPETGKLMQDFASYCLWLDWITKNIYTDEEGSVAYTIFDLPPDDSGAVVANVSDLQSYLNKIVDIQQRIQEQDFINKATDADNKWFKPEAGGIFKIGTDLSTEYGSGIGGDASSLLGRTDFFDTAEGVLTYYFDAQILYHCAQKAQEVNEAGGWEVTESAAPVISSNPVEALDYSTLKSNVDSIFRLDDDENQDRIKNLKASVWEGVSSLVLQNYGSILTLFGRVAGLSLSKYTIPAATESEDAVVLRGRYDRTDVNISKDVSTTVQAMYSYFGNGSKSINDANNVDKTEITELDTSNGILNMMTTANLVNGELVFSNSLAMKNIGWIILCAGATYDPFVSIAGNEAYLATIHENLDKSKNKIEEVDSIIQSALNCKKPLYVTDEGNSEWRTTTSLSDITLSEYRLATLADALQINQSVIRAYGVLRGQMSPSQVDSSTWEYVNKSKITPSGEESTTNVTVNNPNQSGSLSVSKTEGVITVGEDIVSATSQQITTPLMITCGAKDGFFNNTVYNGYPAAVGGLTSVILHNAAQDAKDNSHIKNAEIEHLFLNGLGDIVLSDNTIVMPAAANPVLYFYGNNYDGTSDDTFIEIFLEHPENGKAYYPYTAALMNHYPTAHVDSDSKLNVTRANDLDKYIIYANNSILAARRIDKVGDKTHISDHSGVRVAAIFGDVFSVESSATESKSLLDIAKGSGGVTFKNFIYSAVYQSAAESAGIGSLVQRVKNLFTKGSLSADTTDTTGEVGVLNKRNTLFITSLEALNGKGIPFFPVNDVDPDMRRDYLSVAAPLVTSLLRYLSTNDDATKERKSDDTFLVEHYILDFVGEGLMGTQYSSTLEKNYKVSYEDIVNETGNRFLKALIQLTDNAIEHLGKIDGVLAIKGPYDNTFFNIIISFLQRFYLLIAVVLIAIVAINFLKGRYNMIYVGFIGLVCIAGFEIYAMWLPNLLPSAYNFFVNDIIEDIVWNTVEYEAEKYEDTYKDASNLDPITGRIRPYTSTITLYNLTNREMELVAGRVNVDPMEISKGTQIFLDETAGIYLQGNQIKMSVDSLFVNNTMRGLYQSQWEQLDSALTDDMDFISNEEMMELNNNPYSIQITEPYVSLEAYYTPFDHIERAFLHNLNSFTAIFRIPRNSYTYDNGALFKDAFVVSSYLNSGLFTAMGDEETLRHNIVENSLLGSSIGTTESLMHLVENEFYPKDIYLGDWLNIHSIVEEPSIAMKSSLWGQMMQRRGWYDDHWAITEKGGEKIADLVAYINMQTKVWCIRNEKNLEYMSDENAIKVISLYATTCFTHYVSEWGQWLYPNYINAADIELKDVLYGSMTTIKDRNFAYDGTVTNTVALDVGIFGILFLLLIVIFSTIFIFVITYLIPVLYLLFGGIIIFKFINNEESIGLVKGYTKVTLVSIVLYIIYSLSLRLVALGGFKWYGYLACAIVDALVVYFLFWTVLSVIQDVGELGNNTLRANLLKGATKLVPRALSRLNANTVHLHMSRRARIMNPHFHMRYSRNYNIDENDYLHSSRQTYRRGYNNYGYGDYEGYNQSYGRDAGLEDEPASVRSFFARRMRYSGNTR